MGYRKVIQIQDSSMLKKKISSALDTRLFFFGFKTGSTIYKCDVNEYSIKT